MKTMLLVMYYNNLGNTGIKVSAYCLGAMMFGAWGNQDENDCIKIIDRAIDAGINFIDTADVYSNGESEKIVGKALSGKRDKLVLATKVHGSMGDDINERGNSRRWITREIESSLKRLNTDYIDLYQIHRPDPTTDITETLSVLTDLVHQGKILAFGSSTFDPELIVESQWVSEKRNLERFVCEQPPYSLLTRQIERSVLPTCAKYNMGVIVWSPLAGGWLSGKYIKESDVDLSQGRAGRMPARFDPSIPGNRLKLDRVNELLQIAQSIDTSLAHLAMSFVLSHPAVTSAIIGPRTMSQLEDILKSIDLELSDEVLDKIDGVIKPGENLNTADGGWQPPSLTNIKLRRKRYAAPTPASEW